MTILLVLEAVCALTYMVGVKPGDWATYGDISAFWESTDPEAEMPVEFEDGGPVGWGKFTVVGVEGTEVRLDMVQHFKDGTETESQAEGDLATGMGNLSYFLYPKGLSRGDRLPTGATINETLTRSYAGAKREVNYLGFSGSMFGTNMTNHFYFDRMTGIICELSITVVIRQGDYWTRTSTTMKLTETDLWQRSEIAEFPIYSGFICFLIILVRIASGRIMG